MGSDPYLDKPDAVQIAQFRGSVEGVLGQDATINSQNYKLFIEVKDLGTAATVEEATASIICMKEAYGDIQTAAVILPAEVGRNVINGWLGGVLYYRKDATS